MMPNLAYIRPSSINEAIEWLRREPEARPLAGGQSLLAAAKLGLAKPSHLLDLRHLSELRVIDEVDGDLWIGAMVTHHQMATDPTVASVFPMLSTLARDIADQQVRNRGTIGGSVALHDPSACWPAGVLAAGATIVTSQREISADDFFTGLYATALEHDEIILGLKFRPGQRGCYIKTAQKASHFALVGVAVVIAADQSVRVALTGLGHGVTRWPAAEAALTNKFAPESLFTIGLASDQATSDLHASAAYRCHLARVLTVRASAKLCTQQASEMGGMGSMGSTRRIPILSDGTTDRSPLSAGSPPPETLKSSSATVTSKESLRAGTIEGEHWLSLPIDEVWSGIQDPHLLEQAIPGCESMDVQDSHSLQANIKVGLGFISARFETHIQMHDFEPPSGTDLRHASLRMTISGRARGLGGGQGQATVNLTGNASGTLLTWSLTPEVQGQLAQLGSRMMQATASKLSQAFFVKLSGLMGAPEAINGSVLPASPHSKPSGNVNEVSGRTWGHTFRRIAARLWAWGKRLGQRLSKGSKVDDR
jgi:CO/xanthine dehydrogenase FAD-binding subunit/carbon monoxide dehydrogenase subunit G